jgi:hypothetical protein
MDNWLVVFLGLATWRASHMLWTESGPLNVFMRLRAFLATKQRRMGGLYDMVSCLYCLSVWVAMVPALFLAHNPLTFVGYTLILSSIAIVTHEAIKKLN